MEARGHVKRFAGGRDIGHRRVATLAAPGMQISMSIPLAPTEPAVGTAPAPCAVRR